MGGPAQVKGKNVPSTDNFLRCPIEFGGVNNIILILSSTQVVSIKALVAQIQTN